MRNWPINPRRMTKLLLKLAVLAFVVATLGRSVESQTSLKLARIEAPPKIDGVLDADEWKIGAKAELTYQVYPGDKLPASEKTEAFIQYDKENLYIAFHAFDSDPSAIRAPISKRDDIDGDDYCTIFLDTYDDKQRAYYFSVNAIGIQQDGIYTEGSGSDEKWDGIFESKGVLTKDGYSVEMAIPFKSIRFQAGKDSVWGVHFRRWMPRKGERVSWSRVSLDNSSLLAQAGRLTGLEDIFSGRTIDIIPTLSASNTATREADPNSSSGSSIFNGVNKIDPGLTVIFSITPNATLSATINPDFSQVEADVPQISVNQRFPLFFPEKRPFFLEGSEYFNSTSSQGFRFLDTRQIVDPDWGVKFTGKFGKNTVSALSASDNSEGLRLSPTDEDYGKNALFNVLRFQRNILKDSSIGVFFTDRRFAGSSNTLIAAESSIRFKDVNTIGAQVIWTKTKNPAGDNLSGYAHNLRFTHYARKWRIFLHDEYVQPDYRSQAGFIRRTNYHESYADIGYVWRPKEKSDLNKWLVYVWGYGLFNRSRTLDGRPEVNYIDPAVDVQFKREVYFSYYYSFNHDGFAGRVFNYHFQNANFVVSSFKKISFSTRFRWGENINFDPLNPTVGKVFNYDINVTLKPFTRLTSEFLFLKSSLKNKIDGSRFFNQDILRNRTVYQFNRFNSIRSIVEYDTSQRRAGISLLYAYTPSPNKAFYVGYSDLLFNGLDPLTDQRRPGLFRQSRTLFIKGSYNFRF